MKSRSIPPINFWVLGIILVCLVVLSPLLKSGFFISDDGEWMIIRLTAFFQSLREGQFPVRFLGRLNNSYGYPVANFLYPGFLYLGSFIHALGFSFVDSIKVILIGSVIGTSLLIFFWLKHQFSSVVSFLGTISFTFAPYLLFDLYRRGSIGEILAFFPAALSLYALATNRKWLFPAAIGLLLISHNSLALLFILVVAGYLLIKERWNFLIPFILGVCLAAFFWLPAWFEREFVRFDSVKVSSPFEYFAWGNFGWLLGVSGLIVLAILLINLKKIKLSKQNIYFLIVFLGSIFLALPLSYPFWSLSFMEKLFQFPYRFLAVSILVSPWLVAEVVQQFLTRRKLLLLLWVVVTVGPIRELMNVQTVVRPESYYTTNEGTTTVADEYLPQWVIDKPQERTSNRIDFYQGKGTIIPKKVSTQKIVVNVIAQTDSEMQINSVYYPGWGVLVNEQPAVINYQNSAGLIRFKVPAGRHTVRAEFHETFSRFLADSVSAASLILYIFYLWYLVKTKK